MRRLDSAHVGFGRRDILLAREQKGYIDRYARENCLLDGWKPRGGAGNLDEEIGPRRAVVESFGCGERSSRVMRQERAIPPERPSHPHRRFGRISAGRDRPLALRSSRANSKNSTSPDLPSSDFLRMTSS